EPYPFLIVPGYTPRFGWRPGLHPINIGRLAQALFDLQQGLAPRVIVSGGAVHTADNEAVLMRQWLIERGVSPDRISAEPSARHSTSNLRNAGRMVLASGGREALIVTSDAHWWPGRAGWRPIEHSYYLGHPWRSLFHLRCLLEFGYFVGELTWLRP